MALWLYACTAPDDLPDPEWDRDVPMWTPLVSAEDWRPSLSTEDPSDHRPARVQCPGWHLEYGGVEVETAACDYLSLRAPLLQDLEADDTLKLVAWWQALASESPAEGHLAVYIGDALVWEDHVPIPGPADTRTVLVVPEIEASAGEGVTLHLHNHGYNTWQFLELSRLDETSLNEAP